MKVRGDDYVFTPWGSGDVEALERKQGSFPKCPALVEE